MVSHSDHKACCSIPPVVSEGYKQKGNYEQLASTKTYVTGDKDATKAILYVFDIFGFFPQSLQGADILAAQSSPNNYLVVMPDFFDGKPVDINIFPPQTDEHKATLGKFFETTGAPPKTVKRIPEIVKAVEEKYPNVKEWGIVGFCWGGKVVNLTLSEKGTKFKVGAIAHPAMLDAKDAENVQVPLAVLASKDEDASDVKKFEEALKVEKHVETFGDQIHGWMAARADLSDAKVKKEYERGYSTFLEFICKHL